MDRARRPNWENYGRLFRAWLHRVAWPLAKPQKQGYSQLQARTLQAWDLSVFLW
jgi:hypothetical protein